MFDFKNDCKKYCGLGINKNIRLFVAIIMVSILMASNLLINLNVSNVYAATNINNPVITEVNDKDNKTGQVVSYDCIYMGMYPQTEILSKELADKGLVVGVTNDERWEVDDEAYNELVSETGWDSKQEAIINGSRYRRVATTDLGEWAICYDNEKAKVDYHYYKYMPIKWRVLQVDGSKMMVMADRILDHIEWTQGYALGWEDTYIRCWLNGYGTQDNEVDYEENTTYYRYDCLDDNFMMYAFNDIEKSAILDTVVKNPKGLYGDDQGNDTVDKIFLLADYEISTENAAKYGFYKIANVSDKARVRYATAYTSSKNCGASYALRSRLDSEGVMVVSLGMTGGMFQKMSDSAGIVPAMWVDMNNISAWSYAGKRLSTDTNKKESLNSDSENDTSGGISIKKPSVSKVENVSVSANKTSLIIKWKRYENISGYEIQIATKSNYKDAKTYKIKNSKTTYTLKKLKAKKKYYIRIRAYKIDKSNDSRSYGKWVSVSKLTK